MTDIHYTTDIEDVRGASLEGFFSDWPNPPGPDVLRRALTNAWCFCAAMNADKTQVIGFAYAISDGVFSIVAGAVRRDFRFQSGCGLQE